LLASEEKCTFGSIRSYASQFTGGKMPVVIGGGIVGGSVTINGKRIVAGSGDVVIVGGSVEDLPKVSQQYDHVTSLTVDDCSDVQLSRGEKFTANGVGFCRYGSGHVSLSQFSGDVTCPDLDEIDITINSGSVRGQVSSASLETKVNSGSLNLRLHSKIKQPRISAKVNSGSVNITLADA
jgi:hypothetical protein